MGALPRRSASKSKFQQTHQWSLKGCHGAWSHLQSHLIEEAADPLVVMEIKTVTGIRHTVVANQQLRQGSGRQYPPPKIPGYASTPRRLGMQCVDIMANANAGVSR